MAKKKACNACKLVYYCTPEYLDQVKKGKAEGFDSYANYVKFCIKSPGTEERMISMVEYSRQPVAVRDN